MLQLLIEKRVIGQLDVGIPTFNPNTLAAMKRPTNYQRFDESMRMLQRWICRTRSYSMDLILGLPGDDLEGWKHSIQRLLGYRPRRYPSFLCSISQERTTT